jgi:hypothetical protein
MHLAFLFLSICLTFSKFQTTYYFLHPKLSVGELTKTLQRNDRNCSDSPFLSIPQELNFPSIAFRPSPDCVTPNLKRIKGPLNCKCTVESFTACRMINTIQYRSLEPLFLLQNSSLSNNVISTIIFSQFVQLRLECKWNVWK